MNSARIDTFQKMSIRQSCLESEHEKEKLLMLVDSLPIEEGNLPIAQRAMGRPFPSTTTSKLFSNSFHFFSKK